MGFFAKIACDLREAEAVCLVVRKACNGNQASAQYKDLKAAFQSFHTFSISSSKMGTRAGWFFLSHSLKRPVMLKRSFL